MPISEQQRTFRSVDEYREQMITDLNAMIATKGALRDQIDGEIIGLQEAIDALKHSDKG